MTARSELQFRFATAADVPALVPIINAAYAVESFLESTRTNPAHLAAQLEKGRILIAEDPSGEILASIYIESRQDRAYLGLFAVDPAHQGKGLGRQLFQAVEDLLRGEGFRTMELTVLNLRPELLPIYRHFGFVQTGTEAYSSPQQVKEGYSCHCIVMTRPL